MSKGSWKLGSAARVGTDKQYNTSSIDHCAAENTECKRSKCCKTPGMKCYTTSSYRTAQCFYPGGCDRKKGWECDILDVDLIRR